jgi:hypothetical protein
VSRQRRLGLRSRPLAQEIEVTPAEVDLLVLTEDTGGPLIRLGGKRGPEIACPVCEIFRPFMDFIQLRISEKHSRYVLPVFRCPTIGCRHVFALNPNPEAEGGSQEQ